MIDRSYPTARRLRGKTDFDLMFSRSRRTGRDGIVVRSRENGLSCSRLGVMVSKRSGHAVERNRLRRIVREAFRNGPAGANPGMDFLVTFQQPMRDQANGRIASTVAALLGAGARKGDSG